MRVDAPKDGHTRFENVVTQPLVAHAVFNNPNVLTEAWYPVCPSSELGRGTARSFVIGAQRIVLYRTMTGAAHALDAFCPHMGADLENGSVIGEEIRCYFHHWQFNGQGELVKIGSKDKPPARACLAAYPTAERYGYLWVYAGKTATHALPTCPGLEDDEAVAFPIGSTVLYAHHHVMMAGGIDLQHFATVHQLDVDFSLDIDESDSGVADWKLTGELKDNRWRTRLGRFLLGSSFGYTLRIAGGSIAAITYGPDARFRGTGRRLPSLHILWGCVPLETGVSKVHIFVLVKRRRGLFGFAVERLLFLLTVFLLAILRDDDVKAFPHMRFNPSHLTASDRSVARFIRFVNGLTISNWSKQPPA